VDDGTEREEGRDTRKLSREEIQEHRTWLSQWRTPAGMASYVFAVNSAMGSANFFRQGGVEFLRDAWLAAEFGRCRQSTLVRLVPEQERWPDFEALTGETIDRMECAEADVPGRRRGDEFHPDDERVSVEHDPIEDWVVRGDAAPDALATVVAKKIAKHYPAGASLLIHLNIDEYGIRQAEIEAAMEAAIAPALANFTCIWILWKARLHGPWCAKLN
jgi:hypothetical protein